MALPFVTLKHLYRINWRSGRPPHPCTSHLPAHPSMSRCQGRSALRPTRLLPPPLLSEKPLALDAPSFRGDPAVSQLRTTLRAIPRAPAIPYLISACSAQPNLVPSCYPSQRLSFGSDPTDNCKRTLPAAIPSGILGSYDALNGFAAALTANVSRLLFSPSVSARSPCIVICVRTLATTEFAPCLAWQSSRFVYARNNSATTVGA